MFNNSPYSTYVNNFSVVSCDVIRPLQGICDKEIFYKFFKIFTYLLCWCYCCSYKYLKIAVNGPLKYLMISGLKASIPSILCFCGFLF